MHKVLIKCWCQRSTPRPGIRNLIAFKLLSNNQGRHFRFFGGGGGGGEASLNSWWGSGSVNPLENFFLFWAILCAFWSHNSKVFQQNLGTKLNFSEAGDPLKINFLSLTSLPWLRPCLSHKRNIYKTKCDVEVMTHSNFGRNNGKPAAVTSWGLGDEGGKLRLGGGSWGGAVATPAPPKWRPCQANNRSWESVAEHQTGEQYSRQGKIKN